MKWLDGAPILVPVDFFPCSESALVQGARLAAAAGASLHVFHVLSPLLPRNLAERMPGTEEELKQVALSDSRKALEKAVHKIACESPARIELDSVLGVTAGEILRKADAISADLVVLGVSGAFAKGQGAGDTTLTCLKRAWTNLLIVPEAQVLPFKTVVVGVNFTEISRTALEHAARMASIADGKLLVLHAYDAPWHRLHYRAPTPEANPDFEKQFLASLSARLKEFVDTTLTDYPTLEIHVALMESRNYRQGIVEFAAVHSADLVVLGAGKTRLSEILFGSTAEKLLGDFPGALLVVREEKAHGSKTERT